MITTVCFDVHGTSADDLGEKAVAMLSDFDPGFDRRAWTITIEAHVEAADHTDVVRLWRGEVAARRHDVAR